MKNIIKLRVRFLFLVLLAICVLTPSFGNVINTTPNKVFKADKIQLDVLFKDGKRVTPFTQIRLPEKISHQEEVWLYYEYKGVKDPYSICFSINDAYSRGGILVSKDSVWYEAREKINPELLKIGDNKLKFSALSKNNISYQVRNVRIELEADVSNKGAQHYLQHLIAYEDSLVYVKGFVGKNIQRIKIGNKVFAIDQYGDYEGVLACKSEILEIELLDVKGNVKYDKIVVQDSNQSYDYIGKVLTKSSKVENFERGLSKSFMVGNAGILMDSLSLKAKEIQIRVSELLLQDLSGLERDMTNVTGRHIHGYRFLPHGEHFTEKGATLAIPYDVSLIPSGYTEEDIRTFYFDEQHQKWTQLEVDSLDRLKKVVYSKTTHFSDYINGIIKGPEGAQTAGFVPTEFMDLPKVLPTSGVQIIGAPSANNMGDANLQYPIIVPPGRQGIQPNLSITYNSGGGDGWLGVGWDLSVPSIEVETKWGVPRYSDSLESETYLFQGEQLIQIINNKEYIPHREKVGDWVPRQVGKVQFYKRRNQGGGYDRIEREGSSPADYTWVVTSPNGIKSYYGTTSNSTLSTSSGNRVTWKLDKVEDMYGNYMTYEYSSTTLPLGVDLHATGIYLHKIKYTSNDQSAPDLSLSSSYEIEFIREEKSNSTFSARTGALIANNHLLKEIRIKNRDGDLVRKYKLLYKEGEFRKMLLEKIMQIGSDDKEIGSNTFEYEKLEEVGGKKDCYEGDEDWDLNEGYLTNIDSVFNPKFTYLNPVKSMSGIGGQLSSGWGLTSYAGVGLSGGIGKQNTVGIQYSLSNASSYGKVQMIDVNGDGLPDKVFKDQDGQLAYFPNESRVIDGELYTGLSSYQLKTSFGAKKSIILPIDIENFAFTKTISHSFGPQATISPLNGQSTATVSTTKTKIYFTDVNGDGLVDIVHQGVVFFNMYAGPTMDHVFSSSIPTGFCENYLDPNIELVDTIQKELCQNPLADVVKMWKAPYSGTLNITGMATHLGVANSTHDGVALRIEHGQPGTLINNLLDEYILGKTNPSESINKTIDVVKGDYIFFRVSSGKDIFNANGELVQIGDGRNDILEFTPKITYTSPNLKDGYNRNTNEYDYSIDFVHSETKANTVVLDDVSHSILIEGNISLTEDLCGPVELLIHVKPSWNLDHTNFTVVEGSTITQPIGTWENTSNVMLPGGIVFSNLGIPTTGITNHSVEVKLELRSIEHINIDWQSIKTDIDIKNQNTGDTLITNAAVDYLYYNEVIYDTNVEFDYINLNDMDEVEFNSQIMTNESTQQLKGTASTFYLVKGNNNCNVKVVSFEGSIDNQGNLTFSFPNSPLFTLDGSSSNYYYLVVENPKWAEQINNAELLINDGTSHKITVWTMNLTEKLNLGNMYRNWGTFIYKPVQGDLVIDMQEVLDMTDPVALDSKYENYTDSIAPTTKQCDYRTAFMTLSKEEINSVWEYKWNYGKDIYASKSISKPSRIGEEYIELSPVNAGSGLYSAPTLKSRSNSVTFSAGAQVGFFDVNRNGSIGSKIGIVNYRDLNGDRIPDFYTSKDVQYTLPTGELELTKGFMKTMKTNLWANGFSIGGKTKSAQENNKAAQAGENATVLSLGGFNLKFKPEYKNFDKLFLVDMNGDGLDDLVEYKLLQTPTIRYNIGHDFTAEVQFNYGENLEDSPKFRHENYSKDRILEPNIGFSLYNGSFKGGIGMNGSNSYSKKQFVDFNRDGLIDFITEDGKVYINTGLSFSVFDIDDLPKVQNNYLQRTQISRTKMLGWAINAAFTGEINVQGVKVALTFGGNGNYGMSRDEFRFQDIDGDGYPDFLNARPESVDSTGNYSDAFLKVRRSKIGAVNRLKKITGAFGHEVDIEYAMSAATFNHPNGKWVMKKVTIDDKVAEDGPDIVTHYNYMEGKYDRYEREFLGFGKVIITEGGNYRRTVQKYYTDFAKRSMLKESIVGVPFTGSTDGVDMTKMYNRVVQKVSTTRVKPKAGNTYGRGTTPITDFGKYMLLNTVDQVTKRFFEGTSNGTDEYIGSDAKMLYDDYGNLMKYFYLNDGTQLDTSNSNYTYRTIIAYSDDFANNVLSLPKKVDVTEVDGAVRHTEAAIVTGKNKYEKIFSGSIKTEYKYDTYGNLQKITLPSDEDGNRPEYTYSYESVHKTYVDTITDHFGLETKMLGYNDYGTYEEKIDFNGNRIKYKYDSWGRLEEILGPKELANSKPYTVKYTYNVGAVYPNTLMERYDPQHTSNSIDTKIYCDKLGRVIQTVTDAELSTDPTIAPVEQYVKSGLVKYDALGRVVSSHFPIIGSNSDINLSDAGGIQSTVSYDILDRPVNQTNMGVETEFIYGFGTDNEGVNRFKTKVSTLNVAGSTGLDFSTTTYSKIGNIPTLTESTIFYTGEAPQLQQTSYQYDGFEQVRKVIAPNFGKTTYDYDQHGRVTTKALPEVTESYTYDNLGQITKRSRAGQTTKYIYDRDRLMEVKYPSLSHNNVEFVYGQSDDQNLNRRGRLIMRKDAVGYHEFWYGNIGEVIKERNTYAIPFIAQGATFETEYKYDSWNRVQQITYPDGEIVSYAYDRGGNLRGILGSKESITYNYVSQIGYDKFGQKSYMKCGDSNGQSGLTTTYAYESGTRRLSNLISKNGQGQAFQDLHYKYDNIGNILSFRNDAGVVGSTNLGGTTVNNYTYDTHSRLRTASGTWSGANVSTGSGGTVTRSGIYSVDMKYDVVGNVLEKNQNVTRVNEHFPHGITKQHAMAYSYPTGTGNIKRNQIKEITEEYRENIGASNPSDVENILIDKKHNYVYDTKGNINIVAKEHLQAGVPDLRFEREISNNHENLIELVNDDGIYSHYFYDGNATRRLKILPKRTKIWTNGALSGDFFEDMRFTLYVNPLMVVRGNHYTKHIYANGEMLVSKIGDNSTYNGGKDPISRYNEIKADPQMNGISAKVGLLEGQIVGLYGNPDNIYQYRSSIIHQANEATGCSGDEECHSYYYSKNHLGSSTYITDKEGKILQHIEYLPFGENFVEYRSTNYGTPYRFTGKEQDCETGLYYYGARFYDPSIGVFLSVDPLADKYPGLSPYNYVANNPLSNIDIRGDSITPISSEIFMSFLTVGALVSQADSPLPGPADVVGGAIIVGGTLTAGAVILYNALTGDNTTDVDKDIDISDDSDNGDYITLYRGVGTDKPGMHKLAMMGTAIPLGIEDGHKDPFKHNTGDNWSIFTSWSTSEEVANRFASRAGSGGVIMSKTFKRSETVPSPDYFHQGEVLVPGVVRGASVKIVK